MHAPCVCRHATCRGQQLLRPWADFGHAVHAAAQKHKTMHVSVQARHLLGDSGRSYVVGYGHNPPTHVTHKAASCPGTAIDTPCDASIAYNVSTPNPHVLTGALVSGPVTANGLYADQRTSLENRVSIEYNAGFAGLLAALEQWPRSMTNCLQGRGLFNEKESKKRPV